MNRHSFLDDYSEGAHPEIIKALAETNLVQQTAYGDDAYSQEARALIGRYMGGVEPDIWFVANGTVANILTISSALRPHEAVIAPASGHIVVRETGAIEATGHKIITMPPVDGKLTPESIVAALKANAHFPHITKPRLVYLSNATEVGTLYTKEELEAISTLCKERGLLLLLDGARLGAALSAKKNNLSLKDIAELTDIFWIGGTKVGALLGEAIVISNPELRDGFKFHIKQRGALLAKGRVLGLQFRELFRDGLYFDIAQHANDMAQRLSAKISSAGYCFAAETETNQLFPILPNVLIEKLKDHFDFYIWEPHDGSSSVIRLVTSWATQEEQVDAFAAKLEEFTT
ncbi:aminotransferase class I/II-fold pyridoxal phosphate-dependent enzyme [Agrobacterium rhizogenes]|uniref:threonine aldolase family protein n=1 Tax=Rhizobium rhizogenes TaxID=359 RepID=UPI00115CFA3A|nr:aminotransferase class I/II-fold pyridoxal phosphate-dependent enzyme [Rhizobium rhizogenes]NTI03122.1 aminotransferase class I/II-fold pyridoxal phosphate-dependent enzyme [Rhizobium rhizogenes]NTI09926.1 aminotransferase class I/II-fold pyridoxal phosphate-dependent enzyme [Rhizobium rhizogenes]TRB20271.1 aminotransferase class I/II-fold pyridoxal phosphate-dependent enzyme [Rhizobium rhizogenes]